MKIKHSGVQHNIKKTIQDNLRKFKKGKFIDNLLNGEFE